MIMVLAGCGSVETDEPPVKDVPQVGGARMKESDVSEAEEVSGESEAHDDEQASQEESFGEDEEIEEEAQEETEAPDYEDSLTAAFFDGLGKNSFMLTFERYDVKSVQDITLTDTVSILRYDRVFYERSQDNDNKLTETYYTPVGVYSQVTENGKSKDGLQKVGDEENGDIVRDTLLLTQARNGVLVSADEYSDGTVQEVFELESGERYVYTYFGETGALMSVQSNDTTIMVTTFSEGIDEIELPHEIEWSYPDPNNA